MTSNNINNKSRQISLKWYIPLYELAICSVNWNWAMDIDKQLKLIACMYVWEGCECKEFDELTRENLHIKGCMDNVKKKKKNKNERKSNLKW